MQTSKFLGRMLLRFLTNIDAKKRLSFRLLGFLNTEEFLRLKNNFNKVKEIRQISYKVIVTYTIYEIVHVVNLNMKNGP